MEVNAGVTMKLYLTVLVYAAPFNNMQTLNFKTQCHVFHCCQSISAGGLLW